MGIIQGLGADDEHTNFIKTAITPTNFTITVRDKAAIVVDIEMDALFVNGERVITTRTEKFYDGQYSTQANQIKRKRQVASLQVDGSVIVVNCGWDGRLFFLVWENGRAYDAYRVKPAFAASYWHDRANKRKMVYIQDLSNPKIIITY